MAKTPDFELWQGDSLDFYGDLEPGSFDLVATDPPYATTSQASSKVDTTSRPLKEVQFFEAWIRDHLEAWARLLRPDGCVWLTIDWRGALALDRAAQRLGLKEPIVGVWDRDTLGIGWVLRHSYECFAVLPMAAFRRYNPHTSDVWRLKWSASWRKTSNAAEKPPELFRKAIELFCPKGGRVLDPFVGSGSSALAALETGRHFLGMDLDTTEAAVRVELARADALGAAR